MEDTYYMPERGKDKTKKENEKARLKRMMEKLSDDWDDFQFSDLLSWRQVEEKKIWINILQYRIIG